MARKVVLAGACRTAIGVMGGQFANTSAVELGTIVIKEALKRAGVAPDQVDEVYMGNVIHYHCLSLLCYLKRLHIPAPVPVQENAVFQFFL